MKKCLLMSVSALLCVGCAQTSNLLDQATKVYDNFSSGLMEQQKQSEYQEIVYVKVKPCSSWVDEWEPPKNAPKSNAEIRYYRDVALHHMGKKERFFETCAKDEKYEELKKSEKCRFDYFGELECQQIVTDAENATYLREQNKTEFKITWNYRQKDSYFGYMNVSSHGTYDVEKYASAVEKLKKNKKCKFKSKKEIECNMRPTKEFES